MGVLDTFYVLFKTDADKATKETRSYEDALGGVERKAFSADAAVAGLSRSFIGMAATLAAPIIALVSLSGALNIAFERASAIDDIGDAAGKLRTSVGDYDAFTRAVQGTGGALADAQQTLAGFDAKLADAAARPDGPNAKNFAKWKIAFKDTKGEALGAVDGILSLAKSLEKVSQAEAIGRLKRLGITDADTIAFLLQGKAAIVEKMEAEKAAGVVTERQVEIIGDYQSAVGQTKNTLDTFANRITEVMIPAITKGYQAFNTFAKWVLNNETLVKGFFIGVAAVITVTYLPAITAAAAATIAATWPFLAIGAAIAAVGAAFALAYEDVSAFMNGQPSLIGSLLEQYQWLRDAVKFIGDTWTSAVGIVQAAADGILSAINTIVDAAKTVYDTWNTTIGTLKPLFDAFKNLFSAVGEVADKILGRISSDLSRKIDEWTANFNALKTSVGENFAAMATAVQPLVDKVSLAVDKVKIAFDIVIGHIRGAWDGLISGMASAVNRVAEAVRSLLNLGSTPITVNTTGNPGATVGAMFNAKTGLANASGSPLNNSTPGSATAGAGGNVDQSSHVTVGGVTVNTQATDAKAIAGQIKGALQDQLRQTGAGFDDGVAK